MKKKPSEKKTLRKQLLSGVIYTALSAVVVAVTVNTTVGILSGKNNQVPDISSQLDEIKVEIPSVPELPKVSVPEISFKEDITKTLPEAKEEQIVSDSQEGVDSLIIEETVTESLEKEFPETVQPPETTPTSDPLTIPEDADLGFDTFIKPCNGYVSKEHSVDVPVYSSTMADYRTHVGVDVVCDMGTSVSVVSGGIVTDIYDDVMYGKTVCMKNKNGYTIKYSNLMPELYAQVSVGAVLPTGANLGGIGQSALCEAVEAPHVHLEIYDPDGNPVDPEDLISF